MTCYHPLKAFVVGVKDNGKKDLVITSSNVDHLEYYKNKWLHCVNKKIQTPIVPSKENMVTEHILIPCGQCIGCRLSYSREWANRLMCELQYHKKACFITLTYNDANVPRREYVDMETGEICLSLTLQKRDFQLFMKRLRKRFGEGIRFYACGEYGSETQRPHYHAIIFGVDFKEDRYQFGLNKFGHSYYRSPELERLWTYGNSMIADVSWNCCAYVARYVTKKRTGVHKNYYQTFNVDPEFSLMSRRPGIARIYYEENKERIYEHDEMFFSTMKGGIKQKPPRYFDKIFDLECHEEMEEIRQARIRQSELVKKNKIAKCSKNYFEMLEDEEQYKEQRTSLLKARDKC